MEYVSLQRICEHALVVRYHESGEGYGSPWQFQVTVGLADDGEWEFFAGSGRFSFEIGRRIHRALYDAGYPRIRMRRGSGDRSRALTLTMK